MDELGYWLELLHTPTIGPRRYQALLQHVENPKALFDGNCSEALLQQLPQQARNYLRNPNWRLTEQALRWVEQPGHHILPIHSEEYPRQLKEIADPPPLLFVRGELSLLHDPQLAMVGSRNPSPQGQRNGYDFAYALAQSGLTITSGLAIGVDTVAHQGALSAHGGSVGVIGTGLDICYPRSNRKLFQQLAEQGVIVSEFPLGTSPSPGNFPRRNRIISGLSLGVLVVEASLGSGSLITARLAAEQGREVLAIPGSIHNPLSKGCHRLIRDGAKLVESLEDVLQEFHGQLAEVLQPCVVDQIEENHNQLNMEITLLLKNMGDDPISVDELIQRCGLTAEQISSMLMQLELYNLVASSAGRYYRLPEKATK